MSLMFVRHSTTCRICSCHDTPECSVNTTKVGVKRQLINDLQHKAEFNDITYIIILDDYIFNCKGNDCKTTDKRQEDMKPMSYVMNTYTTIRQEDIKVMSYVRNTYTTIRQEDIKVMSYGSNTYTTIRQEDIKVMSYGRNTYTTIRQEDIKPMSYGQEYIHHHKTGRH